MLHVTRENGLYNLEITEGLVNGALGFGLANMDESVRSLLKEARIHFHKDVIELNGVVTKMGNEVEITARLLLVQCELDSARALLTFRPDGPIKKEARGMLAKMALTLLGIPFDDEALFNMLAKRVPGIDWTDQHLVLDLDRLPGVGEGLRRPVIMGKPFTEYLSVARIRLHPGTLMIAVEPLVDLPFLAGPDGEAHLKEDLPGLGVLLSE